MAIATLFRAAGAEVVASDLNASGGAIAADLSSKTAVDHPSSFATEPLGGAVDILVSNAGTEGPVGPIAHVNEATVKTPYPARSSVGLLARVSGVGDRR